MSSTSNEGKKLVTVGQALLSLLFISRLEDGSSPPDKINEKPRVSTRREKKGDIKTLSF